MAPDRWVVLDDTDPTINYTGIWSQDFGSLDQVGNLGTPYLRTSHGTSVNGTVEFEFNGTAVEVWGTNMVKDFSTNPDPTFECFVDDVSIGRDIPFEFPENNWRFCGKTQLVDGHHTLRIDVKVVSQDQTFWLDQLRYIPSPDSPLDHHVIYVENTDPAIQLDSQWTSLSTVANMTRSTNSSARVNFIGSSISWVAFVPAELPHTAANGTWAIDDGEATQFLLHGLTAASSTTTIYNQIFFTTPDVEVGPHTLTVTFLGNNQTTPLGLDYLYIQNGTSPTSTNNSTTTPGQNNHDNSASVSHIGAILGGVLGGLALLVIITGGVLFWKRRKIGQKNLLSTQSLTPFVPYGNNSPHSMTQTHRSKSTAPDAPTSQATPLVAIPPAQQQSNIARKQREVPGRAVVHPPSNDEADRAGHVGTIGTSTPLPLPRIITTEVRQHMDSGIRLEAQSVVDIPPQYTPL